MLFKDTLDVDQNYKNKHINKYIKCATILFIWFFVCLFIHVIDQIHLRFYRIFYYYFFFLTKKKNIQMFFIGIGTDFLYALNHTEEFQSKFNESNGCCENFTKLHCIRGVSYRRKFYYIFKKFQRFVIFEYGISFFRIINWNSVDK